VHRAPLPCQVRTLLPDLFNLLPNHDPAMLAIALTFVIRGKKIAAEAILREPDFEIRRKRCPLGQIRVHLLRACGVGPFV